MRTKLLSPPALKLFQTDLTTTIFVHLIHRIGELMRAKILAKLSADSCDLLDV